MPLSDGPVWAAINPLELLAYHRETFGHARMTITPPEPPAPPVPPAPTDPAKTYDEAHVQRVAAQQKAEGERAALAKIAEQLGMTVEEAKAKLDASTAAELAAMTEADRKTAEATASKATADRAAEASAAATHATIVERHLTRAGLTVPDSDGDAFITRAVGLVAAKVGDDDAAVKAGVEKLKEQMPALFAPVTDPPAGGGGGDPGAGPGGRQQSAGVFGKEGTDEFDKRFPKKVSV